MTNQLEDVTNDALLATRSFVRVLRNEGMIGWAERFDEIVASLEEGRLAEAIQLFSKTQYTGPGSLSDAFAKDEAAYYAAWGACGKALRAMTGIGG